VCRDRNEREASRRRRATFHIERLPWRIDDHAKASVNDGASDEATTKRTMKDLYAAHATLGMLQLM